MGLREDRKIKILYMTGYLSPHLQPLLNSISEIPSLDLNVWYCDSGLQFRDWKHDLKPRHDYVISEKKLRIINNIEFHWDYRIIDFIAKNRSDLYFITQYDIPTLRLAMLYLEWKGLPWVLHAERPVIGNKNLFKIMLGALIRNRPLKKASAILATGEWSADIFRELVSWGKPVYSVPYYIDLNRYEADEKKGLEIVWQQCGCARHSADFIFIFVGSLIPLKGVLMLAKAFNRLVSLRPECRLLVVGEGPLKGRMEEILTHEARERTWFLSKVEYMNVPSLYRVAHAFVLPTQHDGWGMVINEAMLAGLPVVTTTACGAAHDLIIEGRNGYMIPPHDVKVLAERMIYLASHRDEARAMGADGRRTILERHTPAHGAEKFYEICRDILGWT